MVDIVVHRRIDALVENVEVVALVVLKIWRFWESFPKTGTLPKID